MTDHTEKTNAATLEQAIAHWRSSLSIPQAQRDELEDHLRSELAKLDDQELSPRERVMIAAERMGDPRALSEQLARESGFVLSIPRGVMLFGITAAAVVSALIAHGSVVEIEREVDHVLEPFFGEGVYHWLVYAVQGLSVSLCLGTGYWLARRVSRRYKDDSGGMLIASRWPVFAPLAVLVVLGVALTPHMVRETFNEIDEPIESVLGRGFTMWMEIVSHVLLAGAIIAAGVCFARFKLKRETERG